MYFCCVFVISSFIFLIVWGLLLLFFLDLANGLSVLLIFSTNRILVSLILSLFLKFLFISSLIFIIYFLLLTLGVICSSFSSSFKCEIRLCLVFVWGVLFFFFLRFILFPEVDLYIFWRLFPCKSHNFQIFSPILSFCRRKWQPTSVFLPGEFHGWRNLVSCGSWGRKKSDTTERLTQHTSCPFTFIISFSV